MVWDGEYWPVRVGGPLRCSIEFIERSIPSVALRGAHVSATQRADNQYEVTAVVLEDEGAVVLDLGPIKVVRWIPPGNRVHPNFAVGNTVVLTIDLSLNGWADSPWIAQLNQRHKVTTDWNVARIERLDPGSDLRTEISEASIDFVDSEQRCLLSCVLAT